MSWCNFVLLPKVQSFILVVIVINAITLGLESSPSIVLATGELLPIIDKVALTIFVVELTLKIMALGRKFPQDPWNIFDFIIIAIALIPATGAFSVLRSLRILRVLRVISALPKLRFLVRSLMVSMPSIGWIGILMSLVFYIFAVMATNLFGPSFPEWFGSLGATLYTLFQIMTLESWSMGIVRPVMEVYPHAYLFFVPFVLLSSFVVLNLFIAIMVSSMGEVSCEVSNEEPQVKGDSTGLEKEMLALRQQLDRIEKLVKQIK